MTTLARKLKLHDYFALAFGTMIGTGWLVLMDDWLGRGGPLGAILGFVLGGTILRPVGSAAAGCRRRGRLRCASLPACGQLFHRLDHAALVLHRVSVGSHRTGK